MAQNFKLGKERFERIKIKLGKKKRKRKAGEKKTESWGSLGEQLGGDKVGMKKRRKFWKKRESGIK